MPTIGGVGIRLPSFEVSCFKSLTLKGYRLMYCRCHCQAEFCYVCGEPWKTCECAQWEEERLYDRAHRIVARQPQNIGQPQERALIEAAVNNLRTRHECDHEKWKYVGGRHQCEECSHTLPSYIFECRQCQIRACNRCRRNRL